MPIAGSTRGADGDAGESRDDLRSQRSRRKELKIKAPDLKQRLNSAEKAIAGPAVLHAEKNVPGQRAIVSVSGSETAGERENMPKFDKLSEPQGAAYVLWSRMRIASQ